MGALRVGIRQSHPRARPRRTWPSTSSHSSSLMGSPKPAKAERARPRAVGRKLSVFEPLVPGVAPLDLPVPRSRGEPDSATMRRPEAGVVEADEAPKVGVAPMP
ncbi:uncharacterized protein HMPREF1120_04466 [Exophiala dermatitidis NIH/UT8656]|uniref:Uncharacterized protein n=1 Tax=Exophiala dermatitidis (strain ATCC 34100 / CBS 525.76 / NIH/UT8656) TaxID=858893 RepID=H6C0F6_EXODN|nr:uncharacterized protein HMPREF1120_04466 [Exophiala dermatitidis NIH/UT8656]EHY56384.1 hypothetical protein HMPREF1120_04466 [Exophiala dermatitidis NIH/UT8656]